MVTQGIIHSCNLLNRVVNWYLLPFDEAVMVTVERFIIVLWPLFTRAHNSILSLIKFDHFQNQFNIVELNSDLYWVYILHCYERVRWLICWTNISSGGNIPTWWCTLKINCYLQISLWIQVFVKYTNTHASILHSTCTY